MPNENIKFKGIDISEVQRLKVSKEFYIKALESNRSFYVNSLTAAFRKREDVNIEIEKLKDLVRYTEAEISNAERN